MEKKEIVFCFAYGVIANIILFVLCVLPWYAAIVISLWYIILAFACTTLGSLILAWFSFDAWDAFDIWWDYHFNK